MADGKDVLEELEKEITCAICHDHYTEPKVLPCCHYYCKQCLHSLALRTGLDKPFSCPECRKSTTLPQLSTDTLPSAFFVNRLKETHSKLERVYGKVESKCEVCFEATAEAYCQQCAKFICAKCITEHQRMKALFSGHKISTLDQLKNQGAKEIVKSEPSLQTCTVHEQPMNIYCFDCKTLICRDCTIKAHNSHNYEFVKVAAPEVKKKLSQQLQPLKKAGETLSCAVKEVQTTKSELKEQEVSVLQQIQTSFDELMQFLENRKNELSNEATERVKKKSDLLSSQEESLSVSSSIVQSVIDYIEQCVEHSTDDDMMSKHIELQNLIDKEIEERNKLMKDLDPVEEVDMKVDIYCSKELLRLCQDQAKLSQYAVDPTKCMLKGDGIANDLKLNKVAEFKLETKLSNGAPTKQSCTVNCELKNQTGKSVVGKCEVDRIGRNEYSIKFTPTASGPYKLAVKVNGLEIVGSPFPIKTKAPIVYAEPADFWFDPPLVQSPFSTQPIPASPFVSPFAAPPPQPGKYN